jgi:hypothetical protein
MGLKGCVRHAGRKRTLSVMKTMKLALCAMAASVALATAQTVSETTTIGPSEFVGTVRTFDSTGNSIVVAGPDAAPVTYGYTRSTVLVDDMGNPVTAEVVRSGAPVTVYYSPVDGQMVASKVVVKRTAPVIEERTTTTTTTTSE